MKKLLLIVNILNYVFLIVLLLLDHLQMQVMEKVFIFMSVSAFILVMTIIYYAATRRRKNINDMTLKDLTLLSIILNIFNIIGIPGLIILIAFHLPG